MLDWNIQFEVCGISTKEANSKASEEQLENQTPGLTVKINTPKRGLLQNVCNIQSHVETEWINVVKKVHFSVQIL